ncbi:hypothetical protein PCE31107_04111 [Pandoraea cepalis]|uniref:Uncharacterized protein n=1 Tax=Pandoraea cepalis TaxID=2508294 RepID=A0A5E4XVK2_9BURK|nr:hypothetical protein PCE31107_04111 [Pandoraea cepalis]
MPVKSLRQGTDNHRHRAPLRSALLVPPRSSSFPLAPPRPPSFLLLAPLVSPHCSSSLLIAAHCCSSLLWLLRTSWVCWPCHVGGCRRIEGGCESGWGPPAVRLNRQWSAAGGPQPDGPPPLADFCRFLPTYTDVVRLALTYTCPLRRAASCFNRGAISSRKTASGIDDDGPLQLIASHRFCLTSRNGTATAFTPSCQSRNE